jgi:hypothetical protein
MPESRYAGPALYVPMAVEGLVLTQPSYNALWSWTAPDYGQMARFGSVDSPPFKQQTPNVDKRRFIGVVLHWALPDGLTHGQAGPTGEVRYPDVPNRWLVVRKFVAANAPHVWSYRAFIVASDFASDSGSPFLDAAGAPILIGRAWPLEEWPGEAYVQARATTPLTAPGAGDATYAAYVPNVPTVFGFPDALSDVPAGPITYSVLGWYAGAATDPMLGTDRFGPAGWQTRDEWLDLMDGRSWAVGDDADLVDAVQAGIRWAEQQGIPIDPSVPRETLPSRTLCHGLLFEVGWQGPDGPHISAVPTANPQAAGYVRPQVAVGSSTIDALSALMAVSAAQQGFDPEKVSQLQNILQAFQNDALQLLDQRDAQAQLDLYIQAGWFAAAPGGTCFQMVAPGEEQQPGEGPPPALTPEQRALLSALNENQTLLDATQRALNSQQQALYLLWWKQNRLDKEFPPPEKKAQWAALIAAAMQEAQGAIDATVLRWLALRQRRDAAFVSLSAVRGDDRLVSAPSPSFSQANEPVLMITGAHRAFTHGEDARFGSGDALFCRFTGQTVSALTLSVDGVDLSVDTAQLKLPVFSGAELPREVPDLLAEHAFLDLSHAPTLAALARPADPWPLLGRIREEQTLIWNPDVNAPLDRRTIAEHSGLQTMFGCGALPSKLGVVAWSAPWTPMLVDWRVTWYPGAPSPSSALTPWTFSGGPASTDPRDDFSYAWAGPTPPPMTQGITLQGRTFLTPQATDTFGARIEQTIARYADQPDLERDLWALNAALDYLANADVLSQSLSGFNAALLELQQQVQPAPGATQPIAHWLSPEGAPGFGPSVAPLPYAPALQFNPIRAGHFAIEQLWVVDGFGQVFDVLGAMQVPPAQLQPILGTDLATPGSPLLVQLKPRLTQASRLRFEMLSATDDTRVVGIDADADPVCGWIIANRIDRSLLVYDTDGTPCGELFVARDAARWFPSPINYPPPHGGAPAVDIENRHLSAMVRALLDARDSKLALEGLLALIDECSFAIDAAAAWGDAALPALVGAPIALVRARLGLDLQAAPAVSQRWDDTGTDATGGFDAVALPIQLGSTELLDDGLIGAYLNDDYREINTACPLPDASPYVAHRRSSVCASGPAALLTMLMAPRLKVHALSGVLPPVVLTLPAPLATPRLERMALMFRVGPTLSDTTGVSLAIPAVRVGAWSWVQYRDTTQRGRVVPAVAAQAIAQMPDALPVAREGWLSLLLDGQGTVLSYAVAPTVLPTTVDLDAPSVVALELSAYNASGDDVDIAQIAWTLPVGDGADALTARPELIVARMAAGADWRASTDGRGVVQIVPTLTGRVKAGETLRVSLLGVQVNTRAGDIDVSITETAAGTRPASLTLVKVHP